jgi:hypothetical protein
MRVELVGDYEEEKWIVMGKGRKGRIVLKDLWR